MKDKKVTDLKYLKSICENDNQFIKEMILAFLEMTPQLLAQMRQFAQEEKWPELAKKAHQMKPSLQFMGMEKTRNIIKELEDSCMDKPYYPGIIDMIDSVEITCKTAYRELANFLDGEIVNSSSHNLPNAS